MSELPDHVLRNRAHWDRWAREFEEPGRSNWAQDEPAWGNWGVPESHLQLLPADLDGLDAIELGCGTGYVSAWLARRGARPVGIDGSEAQLATAQRLQREFGLEFPLVHGNAEEVPYPDDSFDLAISEYGASIWCDPYRWIPEASRLLRPEGRLVFLINAALFMLCAPEDGDHPAADRLLRPYFGMHRFEWPDDDSVEFHLPHGEMIALLRRSGFDVEELIEIRPPDGSTTPYPLVTLEWAQRWPCEEVWKARKRAERQGHRQAPGKSKSAHLTQARGGSSTRWAPSSRRRRHRGRRSAEPDREGTRTRRIPAARDRSRSPIRDAAGDAHRVRQSRGDSRPEPFLQQHPRVQQLAVRTPPRDVTLDRRVRIVLLSRRPDRGDQPAQPLPAPELAQAAQQLAG